MDDLLFKNIPAEGFDPNCGFTDRLSNPTPSRSCPTSSAETPIDDRLSNATPSRKNMTSIPHSQNSQGSYDDSGRMSSTFDESRLSTPTPSRKKHADDYSRASNPTPTRRRQNVFSESPVTFPNSAIELDEELSRASNPTPTRRSTVPQVEDLSRASTPIPTRHSTVSQNVHGSSYMIEDVESRLSNTSPTHRKRENLSTFSDSDVAESLTFESADNPYGFKTQIVIGDSRISNPTPTHKISHAQELPNQEEGVNFDNSRLSNYIPSQHK